jgi:hypothetical protein
MTDENAANPGGFITRFARRNDGPLAKFLDLVHLIGEIVLRDVQRIEDVPLSELTVITNVNDHGILAIDESGRVALIDLFDAVASPLKQRPYQGAQNHQEGHYEPRMVAEKFE